MDTKLGFICGFVLLVFATACWEGGGPRDNGQRTATQASASTVISPLEPTETPAPTLSRIPSLTVTPKLPPTLTTEPTTARLLVWVRQDPAIVNPENLALGWDYGQDARRNTSFVKWQVSESSFTSQQRYQEDENVWYDDVVFHVAFERPPIVLNPQLRYALGATFSHRNGALNFGYEGLGETFLWYVNKGSLEPTSAFAYFPYALNFDGISTKKWMLSVPPPAQPGEQLQVSASMMNWPPGRVIWHYVAEYH